MSDAYLVFNAIFTHFIPFLVIPFMAVLLLTGMVTRFARNL